MSVIALQSFKLRVDFFAHGGAAKLFRFNLLGRRISSDLISLVSGLVDQGLSFEDISLLVVFIRPLVLPKFFLGDLNEMEVGELLIPSRGVDPLFEKEGPWLVLGFQLEVGEHQLVYSEYEAALVLISGHLTV